MKKKNIFEMIAVCIVAALIPLLLILHAVQSGHYEVLESEVTSLERKQEELVESNKKLVGDISILSSADRIERRAAGELGMSKASSDDIVRVEMAGGVK